MFTFAIEIVLFDIYQNERLLHTVLAHRVSVSASGLNADEREDCRLFRENTTEDLLKRAVSLKDFSIEVKYMVAVQYVKDGKLKVEVYDIRDGKLTLSDQISAIEVFEVREDQSSIEIDMWGWPCFDQRILEGIFN